MATPASGVLGQATPGATLTTLYTVPPGVTATVRVHVCNIAAAAKTYRIAIREDGDSIANKHYIVYGTSLAANAFDSTPPLELDETDVITVYGEDANVAFSALGIEEPKDA